MKYCIKCEKAMYTSSYSIWIDNKNYPCHKKCLEDSKTSEVKEYGNV